eukprot:587086-Prorocentrum_lima.AAC.1
MEGGVTGDGCLPAKWLCASLFLTLSEKSSQPMNGRPKCNVRMIPPPPDLPGSLCLCPKPASSPAPLSACRL